MTTERLFSYGTLQLEEVQRSTFGRLLKGERDVLPEYEQGLFTVEDEAFVATSGKAHHAIARFTGRATDCIRGTVFDMTPEELVLADSYEPEGYVRTAVTLQSGTRAWVYAAADDH
jgi:hypothetical protein